jgi:hypothetical protein
MRRILYSGMSFLKYMRISDGKKYNYLESLTSRRFAVIMPRETTGKTPQFKLFGGEPRVGSPYCTVKREREREKHTHTMGL